MNPYEIIDKYYPENTQQRQILVIHSLAVSGKAMKMLDAHPELRLNRSFVKEAALLHDIGIFQTDAPTFSALALILISPTDIWELKSCGRKVSPNTHWCANAIREPDSRWKISLPSSSPFLIVRCCPLPWKSN